MSHELRALEQTACAEKKCIKLWMYDIYHHVPPAPPHHHHHRHHHHNHMFLCCVSYPLLPVFFLVSGYRLPQMFEVQSEGGMGTLARCQIVLEAVHAADQSECFIC